LDLFLDYPLSWRSDGWLTWVLGTLLGIYATTNGGNGSTPAYFSDWRYKPIEQFRD
jgi:hypothetical protein